MTFDIPHDLGKAEAKRRIEASLPKLEKHIPGGGTVESNWSDEDTLQLKIGAMGQTIGVKMAVEDALVRGEVAVPMLLSMMSGTIRDFIADNSRKMLEKR